MEKAVCPVNKCSPSLPATSIELTAQGPYQQHSISFLTETINGQAILLRRLVKGCQVQGRKPWQALEPVLQQAEVQEEDIEVDEEP